MECKLLALDLDGTVLTSKNTLTQNTIKYIREITDQDVVVAIATGRNYTQIKSIIKELGVVKYAITNNGACVRDITTGQILKDVKLPIKAFIQVVNLLDTRQIAYMSAFTGYTTSNNLWFFKMLIKELGISGFVHLWNERRSYRLLTSKQMLRHIYCREKCANKISIYGDQKELVYLNEVIMDVVGDEIDIVKSPKELELVPKGINKANGIEVIRCYESLNRNEIVAIGNEMNDVEMLLYAGIGIAMGNAPAKVRDAADKVTLSNDEEGVVHALRNFIG